MRAKPHYRWFASLGRWVRIPTRRRVFWFQGICGHCGTEQQISSQGKRCNPCARAIRSASKLARRVSAIAVAKAKKGGVLPILDGSIPCVDCGRPAAVYDHRDYDRPLDVEPVCRPCNSRRGMTPQTAALRVPKFRQVA